MGTRSKRPGFGVVAVTLALVACGGKSASERDDDGPRAGDAGAGNAGDDDSGGSSTRGGGAGGSAGAVSGGSGGVIGGASSGGFAGSAVGGSPAGGSSGAVSCALDEGLFPATERAPPEVVWDRLSELVHGEPRAPSLPLPETTTLDWVREAVRALLAERTRQEFGDSPGGLVRFMQGWAFEGEGEESSAFWLSAGAFPNLFGAGGEDRFSFLSDRDFLVAHPNSTRRGLWMAENLVCLELALPPPEIVIEPVPVQPNMTRREAVEAAVSDPACAGCHYVFDPLGFSLENYDELGEYRTTENGLPIDASGAYELDNVIWTFDGVRELATHFAYSCTAARCFATKVFQYALARAGLDAPTGMYSSEHVYVQNRFTERNKEFVALLEAIATTPSFLSP